MLMDLLARIYAKRIAKLKDDAHTNAVGLRVTNFKINELRKLGLYADASGYSQAIHYLLEQAEELEQDHKREIEDWFRKYNLNPKDHE